MPSGGLPQSHSMDGGGFSQNEASLLSTNPALSVGSPVLYSTVQYSASIPVGKYISACTVLCWTGSEQ